MVIYSALVRKSLLLHFAMIRHFSVYNDLITAEFPVCRYREQWEVPLLAIWGG